MARTPGMVSASLTFFHKIHNNIVTADKNWYLSEAGGNMSTRSHPFRYHPSEYIYGRAEIFFLPHDKLQPGIDLKPKLSLQRQLMGFQNIMA